MFNKFKHSRFGKFIRTSSLAVAGAVISTGTAFAAADTNVVGVATTANDTFEHVKPIGLTIAGTFLAVAIGFKAWKKFVR